VIYGIIIGAIIFTVLFIIGSLRGSIFNCAPNEVLIFTGKHRRVGGRKYGYRVIKGGMGFRVPLLERVDKMDLTNMVIDVQAMNAYSKGGIPLSVQGVANVKIAGHEPILNNAIERFLGKNRDLDIFRNKRKRIIRARHGQASQKNEGNGEDSFHFRVAGAT